MLFHARAPLSITINETPLKSGKFEIYQAMYNCENINCSGFNELFKEQITTTTKNLYEEMKTEITHCMFGLVFE